MIEWLNHFDPYLFLVNVRLSMAGKWPNLNELLKLKSRLVKNSFKEREILFKER